MSIPEYYRHHKKRVYLMVGAIVVLAAVMIAMKSRSDEVKYLTAKVGHGNITAAVQVTGTINPLTTVPVGSYVSGTVKYIFADFNSHVHAGQVLAQLDPSIYEAQVMEARGNLANAQVNVARLRANVVSMADAVQTNLANVAKAKAALVYAQVNGRRTENLFKEGIIAQDQNDLTQSSLGQAEASLQAAQAQYTQSQAQLSEMKQELAQAKTQVEVQRGALKQAETNFRYTTIVSPIDGTIVARNVTVGQSVAASLQAPVVFSIAQDLKRMQVYAKTDESDTGSIKIGTEVSFQVDAYPNQVFHGRVSAIRLNAYTVQNVVTYDTVIDFENPQEKLLPGETAYVTIPTGQATNAVEIPSAALRFTPEMGHADVERLLAQNHISRAASETHIGGWQTVWKLAGAKSLIPVAVKVGVTDYSNTQMVEGPLKPGDVLVTDEESSAQNQGSRFPGGPGMRRR